jgi:hypothetical protein
MITINMKKPIQCVSCPLWYVTTIREKLYDVCRIDYIVIENPYTLPDWCPIKDIPPHGDLIDRDALKDAICSRLCIKSMKYLSPAEETIVNEINNAPAIIPAEQRDNEP